MTAAQLEESIKKCKQANLCFILTDFNDYTLLLEKVLWRYQFESTPSKYMGILNWKIMLKVK